jgi:hypothetical protein
VLAAPNPLTVALLAIFYSPSLNEGETEMLQNIRGDQLYQNLIHGQMMVGAYVTQRSFGGIMSRNDNEKPPVAQWYFSY